MRRLCNDIAIFCLLSLLITTGCGDSADPIKVPEFRDQVGTNEEPTEPDPLGDDALSIPHS